MAVKEVLCRQQHFDRLEQLTMRDFPAKLPPEYLNRVQPSAVGRQIEQDQTTCSTLDNRFHLVIRNGIVPRNVHCLARMLVESRFQQLRYFPTALVPANDDYRFAGVSVDCA